jgi:hypothetical protein
MAKKSGNAPDTGTSTPGKYVSDKTKLKPGSNPGPVSPGGPGPASTKSKIGKKGK